MASIHREAAIRTDPDAPWDALPDEAAPAVAAMMDQGLAAIKRTLESGQL
jgi:hypothetical protein